jgi:hypothetical protein
METPGKEEKWLDTGFQEVVGGSIRKICGKHAG